MTCRISSTPAFEIRLRMPAKMKKSNVWSRVSVLDFRLPIHVEKFDHPLAHGLSHIEIGLGVLVVVIALVLG